MAINDLSSVSNNGTLIINAIGYYPFDGNANDVSTSGYNGTVTGATLATDHLGSQNNAYDFSSTGHVITTSLSGAGSNTLFTQSTGFSISVWCNPRSMGPSFLGRLVYKASNSSAGSGFLLRCAGTNRIGFQINGGTSVFTDNNSLSLNQFSHVVVTCSATGIVNFYINGALSGTPNQTTNATSGITTGNAMLIGNGTNFNFDGVISDVLIVPIVLTADDVTRLYSVTSAHKLNKPVVTKTDSFGQSITGYELVGRSTQTDSGPDIFGTYIQMADPMFGAGVDYGFYCELLLPSNWSALAQNGNIIGGQFGSNTTITTWSGIIQQREDDESQTTGVVLTANRVHKIYCDYKLNGADYTMRIYVDNVLVASKTSAKTDGYTSHTTYIGYDSRFKYYLNAVISKPIVFNRVLNDFEISKMFSLTGFPSINSDPSMIEISTDAGETWTEIELNQRIPITTTVGGDIIYRAFGGYIPNSWPTPFGEWGINEIAIIEPTYTIDGSLDSPAIQIKFE